MRKSAVVLVLGNAATRGNGYAGREVGQLAILRFPRPSGRQMVLAGRFGKESLWPECRQEIMGLL